MYIRKMTGLTGKWVRIIVSFVATCSMVKLVRFLIRKKIILSMMY